jgi:hypothetical protein
MRDSIDACLTQTFRDVPVPEGLAERLLTGLVLKQPRRSRRWLLVAGGLVTAAASLLLALWLNMPGEERFSEDVAIGEAIQLFDAGFQGPGLLLAKRPAPVEYPFSQWVLRVHGANWRHLDGFQGCSGVVFDLPGPAGTHAALYVVAREGIEDLSTVPKWHPSSTTAGCCASAWQENGLLYVLVVKGDPSTYEGYLNLPRSPVA